MWTVASQTFENKKNDTKGVIVKTKDEWWEGENRLGRVRCQISQGPRKAQLGMQTSSCSNGHQLYLEPC